MGNATLTEQGQACRLIQPITRYVPPEKQSAKRHYGSHQYFTKRAWNVVQEYIKNYTEPGELVCDPYGGSGVTAIEALVLGRRAFYLDISHWAKFLAQEVALAPVSLRKLEDAFREVEKKSTKRLAEIRKMSASDALAEPVKRWYPKNHPLPKNSDVPLVEDLFTPRQLLALSEIFHHVQKVKDPVCRDLLRYVFSATLYMCNRTFISAEGRIESRGGSSIFSIYRYKVADRAIELDPWKIFDMRFGRLMDAKRDTNALIGAIPGGSKNGTFKQGYAQQLTKYVKPESVDYIFTDPPYGAHISYLDLTTMWCAWLGFEISAEDHEAEAIEGGDVNHTSQDYIDRIAGGMLEMFKALKYGKWMSLVFAHREPAMWDAIVKSAEAAGFEYVNTVSQPLNVVWSMHKKKNPLTVLSGELILNFRKIHRPRTLAIAKVGSGAVNLIKDSAELTIVDKGGGATTEQIYNDLIPKLLENGMLGTVAQEIGDITPMLAEEFLYDASSKLWCPKPGKKLGCHVPLMQRIRFYVSDYLNRAARMNENATIDKIVMNVLPKLKNGQQPTEQSIIDEIRKIASPHQGKYWVLAAQNQHVFDFAQEPTMPVAQSPKALTKAESSYEHNEILHMLLTLGRSAELSCHVGKKEQAETWGGHNFVDLSVKKLGFTQGAGDFTRKAVQQIDLIWLDGKQPILGFEVEHSTAITSGIDRFIELLKVSPKMAGHIVLVAPQGRQKKLNTILKESHYIGSPMYLDLKLRYLWYSDVITLFNRFAVEQPNKASILSAVLQALHHPSSD